MSMERNPFSAKNQTL